MERVASVCDGRDMESGEEHSLGEPIGKKGRHRAVNVTTAP